MYPYIITNHNEYLLSLFLASFTRFYTLDPGGMSLSSSVRTTRDAATSASNENTIAQTNGNPTIPIR